MLKIDTDTHFTPIDAVNEVDPAFGEVGLILVRGILRDAHTLQARHPRY